MSNNTYVFFLSIAMVCMSFHMEGMQTIADRVKDVVSFLDRHSGKTLVAALGILVASTYYEEDDSEEDELFNPITYIGQYFQKKEINTDDMAYDLKKMSGKELHLPTDMNIEHGVDDEDDSENGSMDPIAWMVLWDIASR